MSVTRAPQPLVRLWLGLSTDTKPTAAEPAPGGLVPQPGDLFFESDTSTGYVYDPELVAWASWPALNGGGGGGGGNVFVTNFPATQAISALVLPLPTGAATQATLASILTALGSPLQQGGTVDVGNFPSTQPVSAASLPLPMGAATQTTLAALLTALGSPLQAGGTVDVGNFPGTQPVSGTVDVGNFPATQPISAAALPLPAGAATNAELVTINTTLGSPLQAGGTVDVGNFPATQPVSIAGTVNVDVTNTPTVDVGNFPATQAISAAALPLPAGAATNAELVTINTTLGSPLQAGGTVDVGNFPATQAVSAAALPLPAGASTSSGQAAIIAALGSPMQETGGSVSIAGTPTVDVANFPATQPVSGTVAVSNLPAEGQALSAASLPVVIASDQSAVPVSVSGIALPANAAQESGGNLDQIAQLAYINRLILAELRALRLMQASVMTGGQIDPNQLQDTILN